jgi:prepilin-type N-terminal cleavage/methylation domain-containing protein
MAHDQQRTTRDAGFSLLELLLVIGVGALLLVAGLVTYRIITRNQTVNEAVRLLTVVKQQTQRAFHTQGSYGPPGTDLVPVLTAMHAFPAGALDNANTPRDPWGNPVQVIANGRSFRVVFSGISTYACLPLAMTVDEEDIDLVSLDIDGSVYRAGGLEIASDVLLAGGCGSNPSVLTWEFF